MLYKIFERQNKIKKFKLNLKGKKSKILFWSFSRFKTFKSNNILFAKLNLRC